MNEIIKSRSIYNQIINSSKVEDVRLPRKAPSLKECVSAPIIKNYPDEKKHDLSKLIFLEIEKTVRWFNINDFKKPDVDVMFAWAETLTEQFELESVEDFLRFFSLIRKGNIELQMFERLGYDVLQKAFSHYLAEMKLPEKEKQIKNEKVELNKEIDRKHNVEGYANVLKTIEASFKPVRRVQSNKLSTYTKRDEIRDLKASIQVMPKKTLLSLRTQYQMLEKVISENGKQKVIKDKGQKIIESRLSNLATKKMIKESI